MVQNNSNKIKAISSDTHQLHARVPVMVNHVAIGEANKELVKQDVSFSHFGEIN